MALSLLPRNFIGKIYPLESLMGNGSKDTCYLMPIRLQAANPDLAAFSFGFGHSRLFQNDPNPCLADPVATEQVNPISSATSLPLPRLLHYPLFFHFPLFHPFLLYFFQSLVMCKFISDDCLKSQCKMLLPKHSLSFSQWENENYMLIKTEFDLFLCMVVKASISRTKIVVSPNLEKKIMLHRAF